MSVSRIGISSFSILRVVVDKVGAKLSLPCYLISDNILVMPSFSPLASGTDIISSEKEDFLSPYLKKTNLDNFQVLAISDIGLLDFSTVGDLREIEI